MKTLTEFDGFNLKKALETKKALVTAGKTAEELPGAMSEALKVEGDKLTLLLNALEVAESRTDHLKRIVVYSVEEGKKAPSGAVQKGDKFYLAEFFYTPSPKRAESRDGKQHGREGRPGKRGKGRRGSGEGGDKRRDRGGERSGGDKGGERKARPPRAPRAQQPATGHAGPPNVKPLVKPIETSKPQSPTTPDSSSSS